MKQKVYIKLFAGLGNQLFQYAYGCCLIQQGYTVRYILNRTKNDLLSVFCLSKQQRSLIFAPEGILKNIQLLFQKLNAKFIVRNYNTGFYQHIQYTDNFKQNALQKLELTFLRETEYRNTAEYKDICSCTAVSLHIRGGDYLHEAERVNICTAIYYENAVKYIMQTVDNARFFIFTNDAAYAQKLLRPLLKNILQSAYFVRNERFAADPGFDLFLMKTCSHHIIANSTFSWWAAFLNDNAEKIVTAPERWKIDDTLINIQNYTEPVDCIIPDNWIRIPNENPKKN